MPIYMRLILSTLIHFLRLNHDIQTKETPYSCWRLVSRGRRKLSELDNRLRIKLCLLKDACAVLGTINSAILTFFFALVGTLLGALTGALIGQETESGFIRGAAIGAISGAVFSIEVFESSLDLWKSDESAFGCLLDLVSPKITNLPIMTL
ncbi:PREDICTED: NEP1-interacting protein 2-like [Camelina sativa]|uniref:NEP1-interacting protein 2-like n=1 Tax=Camelina sativa TaxID=90675 RepID=A0ABM1Q8P5_CAMSA|nr:PREDICTED: NEP1-interacting protein 2-like [Camelina sativa]